MKLDRIFPFGIGKPGAVCRLYCFHHAGGSVCTFRNWLKMSPLIDVAPLELPDRSCDPSSLTFESVLDDMTGAIAQTADSTPFFIYGHSLGSLFGFQTACELEKRHGLKAERLFVAGRHAPPEETASSFRYSQGIGALEKELKRCGMESDEMLSDKTFRSVFLPIIYNDYRLNEEYVYNGDILDIPITAMNGSEDADADGEIVDKWAKVTSAGFERYEFRGNHFFPYGEDEQNVITLIREKILLSLGYAKP